MPLYEYQCEACEKRFERIQKFSDPPVDTCPTCNGKVKKLLSSPAFQFKGTGWYVTDYAKRSGSADKADKAPSSSGTTETKSESSSKGDSSSKSDSGSTSSKEKSSEKSGEKPAAAPTTKSE